VEGGDCLLELLKGPLRLLRALIGHAALDLA
jgi:hypothetical protein